MTAQPLLDLIIRSGPSDFLKRHGFRKKGRAFYREIRDVFQYLHFFTTRWTSAEVASFTLQVGVTLRQRHPKPPENMLTGLIPIAGRRFGPHPDNPIEQFWMADSAEPTASEVVERITNHVMPFFTKHTSIEVARIWDAGGRIVQLPTLEIPKAEPCAAPNGGPATPVAIPESRGDRHP